MVKIDSLRLMKLDVSPSFDQDDASAVSTSTVSRELAQYAPTNAPYSWLIVNGVILLWSTLLVLEIAIDSDLHPLEQTHLYLIWNFGTTFCWCIEVALTALANEQEAKTTNGATDHAWATVLELVLAIYCIIDSIRLFRKWRRADGDIVGELMDATINMLGYGYLVVKAQPLSLFRSKMRNQKYELIV